MDRWSRAKLQADRMLRAAGFQDAESGAYMRNPLGRTSSHGRDVPAHVLAPLEAARRRDAAEYREWANGVLRRYRFRSSTERDVWARHADGEGLRDIAKAVGWTYHRTRTTVGAIKRKASEPSEPTGAQRKCTRGENISVLMKRCDLRLLLPLAAAAILKLKTSSQPASG